MTDEPNPVMRIRVKQRRQQVEKRALPAAIERGYPARLLVAFIDSDLLARLRSYAASNTSYELGGVLVGTIGKASRRLFIEIRDFIPATKGVSHRAAFEFTNEAQQEIHEIVESKFKDMRILGWFHTHPGYGIFLSAADQFIDQHYFNQKYHVAIVIDPCRPEIEIGAFAWSSKNRRRRIPLFEL